MKKITGFDFTNFDLLNLKDAERFTRHIAEKMGFELTITRRYDALGDVIEGIYNYWDDFDVSSVAYLWLGSDGHGKNGAPYEMIDVYNDFKACESYIFALYDELDSAYWNDIPARNTAV